MRAKAPKVYDVDDSCKIHWKKTAKELLIPWAESGVQRESLGRVPLAALTHTPMWLRIVKGRLHCVRDPRFKHLRLRMKLYRAMHYIIRVNRVVDSRGLPEGTEWWTQHSDFLKVPRSVRKLDGVPPPVMSVAGGPDFWDIPAIPFMSFSDRISSSESAAFNAEKKGLTFEDRWAKKKASAFFLGGLSDCANAVNHHNGDPNFCARAKVILQAATSGDELISDIQTYTGNAKLKGFSTCSKCTREVLKGYDFVSELMKHKYVLSFDGAGNWSRRMAPLLNSGSVILKSESNGYQFFEYGLEPGVHYVPFSAKVGRPEHGNLIPRINWLHEFDDIAKGIARRAESFADSCLSQSSIDDFVYEILASYSRLLKGRPKQNMVVDISKCRDRKSCRNVLEKCFFKPAQHSARGGK